MDSLVADRPAPSSDRPRHGYERLIMFSDAVFAIAATLLFFNLRPPSVSGEAYEQALRDYLSDPGPFLSTTIGFIIVGSYWSSHRRTFSLLRDTSGAVVWANLVFLYWVAVQPFLTAALAEHPPNRTSVMLYTLGQIATGAAQFAVWIVARRQPTLLTSRATPRRIRYVTMQLLRAPLTFALSIPITLLVDPLLGMYSWGLMVLFAVVITRSFRDLDDARLVATAAPAAAPLPEQPAHDGQDALDPQAVLPTARMEAVARDQ